jgi:hypothetical protein
VVVLFLLALIALFVAPAGIAFGQSQRSRPRSGSMLATMARIAMVRAITVVVVLVVEGVAAFSRFFDSFAVAVGDAPSFERMPRAWVTAALVTTLVTTLALLVSIVLFVYGLLTALRIRRVSLWVRADADRADPPRDAKPTIDFGVGDAFWVFRHTHASGYRESAKTLEWAHGTPPPPWAPFVAPALDMMYGLAFALLCAANFAMV